MFSTPTDSRYPGHVSPGGSEPMALGSPVSSPKNQVQSGLSYLPPYLIGNTSISPASTSGVQWSSPIGRHSATYPSLQMSPAITNKSLYQDHPSSSSMLDTPKGGKSGGPPVQSMFDVQSTTPSRSDFLNASNLEDLSKTPSKSFQDSHIFNSSVVSNKSYSYNPSSFMSPAQIDPFFTQGETLTSSTQLDETWVTLFGFPPAATSYICQQFSQYGKIIDQKLATSGNWIHIKYQSKLQAKKALSKNGKTFGGNIMVGVKPCIELEVMNDSGKENSNEETNANFCQDAMSENLDSNRSLRNIRPLTQIYTSPVTDTEVTQNRDQQNSSSLVSKAKGFFKWL